MPTTDSERRKLLIKNLVLWIVIVLVMLAVFSRYMPTSKKTAAIEAGTECLRGGEKVFCPPANGSIATVRSGQVVCGRGECLADGRGGLVCSAEPGGHAARDSSGSVVCTGGCEPASASVCETPR